MFSEQAKQSIEDLAFTVQPSNIMKNCARVVKYFNKGFDVILPDLDVLAVPTRHLNLDSIEILDLPFLRMKVTDIKGNKIHVSSIAIDEKVFTKQHSHPSTDTL